MVALLGFREYKTIVITQYIVEGFGHYLAARCYNSIKNKSKIDEMLRMP